LAAPRQLRPSEGCRVFVVLLIWAIPSVLLSIPAGIVGEIQQRPSPGFFATVAAATRLLAAIGSVWGLLVLLLEAAILSQFLEGGFWAALNVNAVIRRLRVNLGLSIVVGTLIVVLSTVGLIGLAALGVGVLVTIPYASFVASYLVGRYARLTDEYPGNRRRRARQSYTAGLRTESIGLASEPARSSAAHGADRYSYSRTSRR
jgi:hypothetical protein